MNMMLYIDLENPQIHFILCNYSISFPENVLFSMITVRFIALPHYKICGFIVYFLNVL